MNNLIARNVQLGQEKLSPLMHGMCNHKENQDLIILRMDYAKIIGQRIFEARKLERGWTREQLSERTDGLISPSQLNNYEHGTRMLGPAEAVLLGQALEKRPGYFLGVDDVQTAITTQEEVFIRNWRALAENERMKIYRQVEQKAMLCRDPVPDSMLEHLSAKGKSQPKQLAAKKTKR